MERCSCWALFDVYLGRDPVSKGGKKPIIAWFPMLLGAGGEPGSL